MSWQGKGSTRAWRRTRARILYRDGHTCQIGGPRCTGEATQVHHVLGRGVSEQDADLLACCWPCNIDLGDPTTGPDPTPRSVTPW